MTGHIPGATVLRPTPFETSTIMPGSNHVALRATNERLVLSLIRSHGELSKAQLAELSGLTAQTTSVISRSLVEAGLLLAGNPIRGNVGQPYVPLRLNPQGAMFFGLHIHAGQACLALIDFTGQVITEMTRNLGGLNIAEALKFTHAAINTIRTGYNADQNARIQGLGASVSSNALRQDKTQMSWQQIDTEFAALGQALGIATYVSTEAVAACSAELIYGLGGGLTDFAYVFIDDTVSGGLVQNGRIHFSRDSAGASMGKVLVPDAEARMVPLRSLADAASKTSRTTSELELLARGIAFAVHSAAAVVSYSTVIIDGTIPVDDLRHISSMLRGLLAEFGDPSTSLIPVREGSHARKAVAFGAACLPLADRFYPYSGR